MEGSPTLTGPFASELILSVLTLLEAAVPGHQGSDSLELSMPGTALAAFSADLFPATFPRGARRQSRGSTQPYQSSFSQAVLWCSCHGVSQDRRCCAMCFSHSCFCCHCLAHTCQELHTSLQNTRFSPRLLPVGCTGHCSIPEPFAPHVELNQAGLGLS